MRTIEQMTVLILTPLPIEFEAVIRHLSDRKRPVYFEGAAYESGTFTGQHHTYTVVLREPGMKNVDMALATEKAIQRFKPQLVFLVGIAGGVKDVRIGDIVIANKAYGYESGKEDADGSFKARPSVESLSAELLARAQTLSRRDGWRRRTRDGASDARVFLGPIAAGEKVIASADNPSYQRLKGHFNDTLALELESIGFATALQSHRQLHGLIIRGISDLCEGKAEAEKGDGRELAAERAAAVTMELLDELDYSTFTIQTMDAKIIAKEIYELLFPDALKEIGKDFADATNGEIRALWKVVKPIFIQEVEELAKTPEDGDAQAGVRNKLKRAMEGDKGLLEELNMLAEKAKESSVVDSVKIENSKNVIQGSTIKVGGDFNLGDTASNIHHGSGDIVNGDKIINQ